MFNLVKDDYDENLDDVMKSVNKLLNNYGYEITFYEIQTGAYESKEHTEIGKTNDTKEFK